MDVRLDRKEGWAMKNCYFQTVVLEKTLESPLDSKEIKAINSQEISSEYSLEGKDSDARKDWEQEEKEATEDEMVGWHHWLDGNEFEQASGGSEGQGSATVHRFRKSLTQLSNWTTATHEGLYTPTVQPKHTLVSIHVLSLRKMGLGEEEGFKVAYRHTLSRKRGRRKPSFSEQPRAPRYSSSAVSFLATTL